MEKAKPYTALSSAQGNGSKWEPDESRGSSPVLREPRGEIPRGHSPSAPTVSTIFLPKLHPVFFDHRIGQDVARNLVDLRVGLFRIRSLRQGNLKKFALPHCLDGGVPQACQRGPYGLSLWI